MPFIPRKLRKSKNCPPIGLYIGKLLTDLNSDLASCCYPSYDKPTIWEMNRLSRLKGDHLISLWYSTCSKPDFDENHEEDSFFLLTRNLYESII